MLLSASARARALQEIAGAAAELTHRGDDRHLRLCCTPGLASQWLAPRLGQFCNAYPQVDMEFEPTYSTPNFSSHEADAALQYVSDATDSGTHESQLRSIEIAKPDIYAVASPAFVAGIKSLDAPADLLRVPLVHETSVAQWERWFIAQGIVPQIAREDRWQDHTIEEFRIWLQQEVSTTLNLAGRKP